MPLVVGQDTGSWQWRRIERLFGGVLKGWICIYICFKKCAVKKRINRHGGEKINEKDGGLKLGALNTRGDRRIHWNLVLWESESGLIHYEKHVKVRTVNFMGVFNDHH